MTSAENADEELAIIEAMRKGEWHFPPVPSQGVSSPEAIAAHGIAGLSRTLGHIWTSNALDAPLDLLRQLAAPLWQGGIDDFIGRVLLTAEADDEAMRRHIRFSRQSFSPRNMKISGSCFQISTAIAAVDYPTSYLSLDLWNMAQAIFALSDLFENDSFEGLGLSYAGCSFGSVRAGKLEALVGFAKPPSLQPQCFVINCWLFDDAVEGMAR